MVLALGKFKLNQLNCVLSVCIPYICEPRICITNTIKQLYVGFYGQTGPPSFHADGIYKTLSPPPIHFTSSLLVPHSCLCRFSFAYFCRCCFHTSIAVRRQE